MNIDYNNNICKKIVDYIKFFIQRVEYSSDENVSINIQKYVVIDTNNFDINYLQTHGLTGTFTVKVYFEVTNNGVKTEFDENIEIPKMINNVFVIEGAMRVPTNTLDNDDTVTIYDANVRLNDVVNVTYMEDEHQPGGYLLTIFIYEDEEPIVLDGTEENFEKYKEYLKLKESERDKLKVKLDTDNIGEYLTRDYVMSLIELGPDKTHDNMIDKKIFSAESNLMKYLWSRDIRKRIMQSMKSKFYQYNHIYLKDIQSAINRYFIVASEKNIDIPSTVNPLIFDAMKFKVVLPQNVAFNQTMTDIVDVVNTPINQSVNRINELNVCTEVKDDVIYIKCYTYPEQVPVTIPYTHYCTKKVLINDYWDYDKKQFKDGVKNLNYRLRLKTREGTTADKFDYIEPKADDKLSITTRRIPLGNMSDSVRIGMANSMQKQAVELQSSEPPLVDSGHDEEDFNISTLITKYDGEGAEVVDVKDNKIFVKDKKTGTVDFYEVPSPTPAAADSIISFDSAVKKGDILSKDKPIIMPHILRRKSFELGTNVNAVYMSYLGYTHEDGIVISESLADRMIHYSIIDVYKEIFPDDIIKYIRKIGSKVTSKDVLVNDQTRLRVSQALKDTYMGQGGLLSGMGISYNQSNLIVPNNIDEGYILDVRIVIHPDRQLTSEVSNETIKAYEREGKSEDYLFIPEKYRSLHANDVEMRDQISGYISIKILRVDRCKIGDKATNRYGSKGIIALVMPDKCMPQIEKPDGSRVPVEIVLNPSSVLHRKNLSQLYECALSKVIKKIYNLVSDLVTDGRISEAKKLLSKYNVIYRGKFDNMSDKEFVDNHNKLGVFAYRMEVGFFSKVSYDTILEWMKDLQIEETEKIFLPDVCIFERAKEGRKVCLLSEYEAQPGDTQVRKFELGYTDQPCVTGSEYYLKLWKRADYDGKVTSEVLDSEEPVMGRGKYRYTGQKIGEMEQWILMETGIEKFVQDQSDTMKTSQYLFLNELLLSGYYIQDPAGNPLLSNSRTRAQQLEALGQ